MHCTWFKRCTRQIHLDFHTPEFPEEAIARWDAERFAGDLERMNANFIALFAKCHFGNSYYDTRVGHKHAGLKGDFLAEASAACRERDVRALAYYSLSWDKRAWDEHPDWRFVDADGRTHGGDAAWGILCMNSPYADELVLPQLREVLEGYPIDGLWLDIPYPLSGGNRRLCRCEHCRRKWDVDLDAPMEDASEQQLIQRTVVDFLRKMRALIDRTDPSRVVCVNCVGDLRASHEVKSLCEIGTWEAQPYDGDWLNPSYACRAARNDVLDVQVMTVRFHVDWGDHTLKPLDQLITECAIMLANGMPAVLGDEMNVDGTLQPAAVDAIGRTFAWVREREALLADAQTVRHVAVLLPVPDPALPMEFAVIRDHRRRDDAWRGAHKVLVESHAQFDLLTSIPPRDLDDYAVVILPEPCAYADEAYPRLREYVSAGGTLIAVGSSLVKEGTFQLADVFGIRYIGSFDFNVVHFVPGDAVCDGPRIMSSRATPTEGRGSRGISSCAPGMANDRGKIHHGPTSSGVRNDTPGALHLVSLRDGLPAMPLQMPGRAMKVERAGAAELAALHLPLAKHDPPRRAFRHPYPPPRRERSTHPFATVRRFGKGSAIYVAGSLFEVYWQSGKWWLRRFFENLLRHVDPAPPFEIDAPARIEANLMRKDDDLLLNLVQRAPGHRGGPRSIPAIERVDAIRDVPCAVRCERVERVTIEPGGTVIPHEFVDGTCRFVLPELRHMAIVRIAGAAFGQGA